MSLPVRPSSSPHTVSPNHTQEASATPTENEESKFQTPRKHTAGSPLTNTTKRAKMSQVSLDTSPLSSPPSSLPSSSPRSKSPNPLSSAAIHQAGLVQTGPATEPSSQPLPAPAPASDFNSTIPPTSNMSAKRAPKHTPQTSPKRAREEEDGDEHDQATLLKRARSDHTDDEHNEDVPAPKRPVAKSRAKAKPKPPARKATVKKPATKLKSAPKKPARPPPAPSTRPSRSRKAPDRFEDYQEPEITKPTPAKKGMSKVFDPIYITTNSNSRLGKADVHHMLLEGSAWTSLTATQQSTLIGMLPPDAANQALLTRIQIGDTVDTRPRTFTLSNDCFRTDVAKFKEDLSSGHLAKTWLAAAEQAVLDRAKGNFEEWKREEAERWWGQKGGQ